MALSSAYLVTTKNLDGFFNAIRSAKAPERFTNRFLTQLDFTSSNDRLYLGVMKALGFIDESGVPTKRYYAFLDQSESPKVLAEAVREAYEDLFAVNKRANELSVEDVKNKLKTLTQGQKSDHVIGLMANTFKALANLSDWEIHLTAPPPPDPSHAPVAPPPPPTPQPPSQPPAVRAGTTRDSQPLQLRYDIHIHLPESRDPAVFDAIFEAMKRHLT
jgi:hypothetical protein